jgi:hypothetical protein
MIDQIELTTTAKYNDDAGQWIAKIPGYPVAGRGDSPEEAILSARDELHQFFEGIASTRKRIVRVQYEHVSLKTLLTVSIDTDRGTSLTEFGLDLGREGQEGSE